MSSAMRLGLCVSDALVELACVRDTSSALPRESHERQMDKKPANSQKMQYKPQSTSSYLPTA